MGRWKDTQEAYYCQGRLEKGGATLTETEFLEKVNSMIESEDEYIYAIPDEEYKIIEKVYAFHPAIDDSFGKDQIARLYVEYGWSVIMDMLPRAEQMEIKMRELDEIKSKLAVKQEEISYIRSGGRPLWKG